MLDDSPTLLSEFARVYLAAFFTFVAVFYTSRIFLMKRREQRAMVFAGGRFSASWWNHMTFRGFRITIWLICLFRLFFPQIDDYLGIITAFNQNLVIGSGLVLLTLGFGFTMRVHFSMGCNWRSGIDPKGPEELITDGAFRYSRNPMFMGIFIAQLGFFLALPSLFTLLCLIVGVAVLQRQAACEESHLQQIFGESYLNYQNRVSRWLSIP